MKASIISLLSIVEFLIAVPQLVDAAPCKILLRPPPPVQVQNVVHYNLPYETVVAGIHATSPYEKIKDRDLKGLSVGFSQTNYENGSRLVDRPTNGGFAQVTSIAERLTDGTTRVTYTHTLANEYFANRHREFTNVEAPTDFNIRRAAHRRFDPASYDSDDW